MNFFGKKLLNTEKTNYREEGRFFLVCVFLVIWFMVFSLVNAYNFTYVEVVGHSMDNTLSSGDVLLVNKRLTPDYGDIVVISGEKTNGDLIIKRIIGKGGDEITLENGRVYRNGVMLNETYAKGNTYFQESPAKKVYVIPEGELFYLGDNRENSSDSRVFGTCEVSQIEGVVPSVSLSLRPLTLLRIRFSQKLSSFFGGIRNVVR